jgi:hypothetical protein
MMQQKEKGGKSASRQARQRDAGREGQRDWREGGREREIALPSVLGRTFSVLSLYERAERERKRGREGRRGRGVRRRERGGEGEREGGERESE